MISTNNQTVNSPLTDRQIEVLKLIADGCEDRRIAEYLGISIHTVRAFVHKIINKLDAKNRVHAACKAIRLGIIK